MNETIMPVPSADSPWLAVHEDSTYAKDPAATAKNDFLANLTHEIRTPMTAILGFADTLLEPDLTDGQRLDAVATIKRQGTYLLQVFDDMLDYSKIESGTLRVEPIDCAPRDIIRDALNAAQAAARAKGLSFDVECVEPFPLSIRTDPIRLRQVLVNLLDNAVKFTHSGGIHLTAGVQPTTESGPTLQFDVIDTGTGMTPQQARALFRPFTQGDSRPTRQFGGTGLGLAISKKLAQALGGDVILLQTMSGGGSHFRATIATQAAPGPKLARRSANFMTTGVEDCAPSASPGNALRNLRILVAEDGIDNQRLIRQILEKAGAQVTVAADGREACDAVRTARLQQCPFDVILMDMQMPVLDGYSAAGNLRAGGYDRAILALTANTLFDERDKCLRAGCNEYLTKPIDREALIRAISRFAWHRQA